MPLESMRQSWSLAVAPTKIQCMHRVIDTEVLLLRCPAWCRPQRAAFGISRGSAPPTATAGNADSGAETPRLWGQVDVI
jgi:hypothetical protein